MKYMKKIKNNLYNYLNNYNSLLVILLINFKIDKNKQLKLFKKKQNNICKNIYKYYQKKIIKIY